MSTLFVSPSAVVFDIMNICFIYEKERERVEDKRSASPSFLYVTQCARIECLRHEVVLFLGIR